MYIEGINVIFPRLRKVLQTVKIDSYTCLSAGAGHTMEIDVTLIIAKCVYRNLFHGNFRIILLMYYWNIKLHILSFLCGGYNGIAI